MLNSGERHLGVDCIVSRWGGAASLEGLGAFSPGKGAEWRAIHRAQKLTVQTGTGWPFGVRQGEGCGVPATDLCALQFY